MKIGPLTASVSRRAGGLYDAIRHLAHALHALALDVPVFGLADHDTERDQPGWGGLPVQTVAVRGPRFFGYAPALSPALQLADLDLLHTHGLWMYPSVAGQHWRRRQQKPLIITPHGMLDPWAVRNAQWKKRLAGWLYENAHLRGAACLHALCEAEAEAIRAYGLRNPICIIPNGIDPPAATPAEPPPWQTTLLDDAKVLFYLGRLHPKKGLPHLLRAWAAAHSAFSIPLPPLKKGGWGGFRTRNESQIPPNPPLLKGGTERLHAASAHAAAWHLVIAGWDQGGHEAELKAQAEQLGLSTRVHFVGPQFNAAKHASYCRADAFILPSFSEGLPMTVLEAWSYGLPVLMTPQCNLPEGFQADAALRIDPEPERIAQGLAALFAMPDHERTAMGERGRALVAQRFTWPGIAQQMRSVYQWVLGQGEQPDCVISD